MDRIGRSPRFPLFTTALILTNLVVFLADLRLSLVYRGALSLVGLREGHLWQLITYQFLHGGVLHLLLNCWMIFVFGRPLEEALGKSKLALLYLTSGVAGGALQVFASLLSDARFGGPVVGASAGVFGLIAAFTYLFPEARMTLLLFFVIPVRMTANRLLTVAAVITVVGIMFPNWLLGKHVAHAAHLGGLVAGLIVVRMFLRRYRH